MINIQKQYYTRIQWKLVKASLWDRFKFKATFGLFGRMEWLDRNEQEIVLYIAPNDERTSGATVNALQKRFNFNGGAPARVPSHINCRCSVVKL